jgi:hypothetical protein
MVEAVDRSDGSDRTINDSSQSLRILHWYEMTYAFDNDEFAMAESRDQRSEEGFLMRI